MLGHRTNIPLYHPDGNLLGFDVFACEPFECTSANPCSANKKQDSPGISCTNCGALNDPRSEANPGMLS